MHARNTFTVLCLAAALTFAGGALAIDASPAPVTATNIAPGPDSVTHRIADDEGRTLYEFGIQPGNPLLAYTTHYVYKASADGAKPDKPGNGGGGGGGGGGGNDCTSTSYRTGGWYWTGPYSATASSYANIFNTAANTWDSETGAGISGGISSGSQATAGVQDFVNQIDFVNLGGGGTVAVTTTWYYRGSGQAVESDARYNTFYAWSTNGDANAMDVQHVGTHEIGHTFGLDHPSGPSSKISCLTMYAYVDYGWTHGRTLGVGDILGIEALYGA